LLYGQGEFVTKHHAIVVSAEGPRGDAILAEPSVQHIADAKRGLVPSFSTTAEGEAMIETFTVIYDRDGAASHGVVIARMQRGERVLARVTEDISRLTNLGSTPIGAAGEVALKDAELAWAFHK
jgi:hypothetical protein